ncbi:MAG: alpha-glucoside transport system substrate-binding protein [Ilumatobacter sp.]|jgi:alpha-glucoside transport system substrate-binding protein
MSGRRIHRFTTLGAIGIASILFAVGCAADGDGGDPIVVFGPYRNAEADRLVESLEEYAALAGVEVRYTGSTDFVTDLTRRINSADAPDVALVPQPGLVNQLVDDESIFPLDDATRQQLVDNYNSDVLEIAEFDGVEYAVPFRRTMKSVVWFRRDVFETEGWALPTTLDELEALSAMIADGERDIAPWCFSISAGDATGWAATDWVEDLVVRRQGKAVYDQWTDGTVEFVDPAIEASFSEFRDLVLKPGRAAGGLVEVVSRRVDRAWEPLLRGEPGCAMYRQADFAIGWMPSGTKIGPGESLDWFVLPGVESGAAPLVIGGDEIVQFDDRSEVNDLMAFLASADAGTPWASSGGFLSAKSSITAEVYPDVEGGFVKALATSPVQVFDASDQMLPEIGSGLLWVEITKWVSGAITYAEFAETIDTARRQRALEDID